MEKITTIFLWSCLLLLGLLSLIWPEQNIQLTDDLALRWKHQSLCTTVDTVGADTLAIVAMDTVVVDSVAVTDKRVAAPIVCNSRPQPATNHFDRFAEALKGASSRSVRVIHYGDSQIEEDRITCVLRRHLQAEYGGGGVGLIPLHQTIPTRTMHQRLYINGKKQSTGQGPKRYLVYGSRNWRRENNQYGPMGQVAMMDDNLVAGSEDVVLNVEPTNYGYPVAPYSEVKLWADDSIRMSIQSLDTIHLMGRGAVYGLSLQTPTGVMVDNIPMRGSLGTVFTDIDSVQLKTYFDETNTALIILQYGGNFLAGAKTDGAVYGAVRMLRKQVNYLQRIAPNADILFIGPSDMLVNDEGELVTNPLVSLMDSQLAKMARDEGIGYWSLFHAMGGQGSMLRWQETGWAGVDGVHFTRSGANHAGDMLWNWLKQQITEAEE